MLRANSCGAFVSGTEHASGKVLCMDRSEEHTSELQSQFHLVCRLLLEKKKKYIIIEFLKNDPSISQAKNASIFNHLILDLLFLITCVIKLAVLSFVSIVHYALTCLFCD